MVIESDGGGGESDQNEKQEQLVKPNVSMFKHNHKQQQMNCPYHDCKNYEITSIIIICILFYYVCCVLFYYVLSVYGVP